MRYLREYHKPNCERSVDYLGSCPRAVMSCGVRASAHRQARAWTLAPTLCNGPMWARASALVLAAFHPRPVAWRVPGILQEAPMATDTLASPAIIGSSTKPKVYKNFIDGEWVESGT